MLWKLREETVNWQKCIKEMSLHSNGARNKTPH